MPLPRLTRRSEGGDTSECRLPSKSQRVRAAADAEDSAELLRLYHSLDPGEAERLGIDVLRHLISIDPVAARPILEREIERPGDAWLITFALERIQDHDVRELRDVVGAAERAPRRRVARYAASVGKRLDERARG